MPNRAPFIAPAALSAEAASIAFGIIGGVAAGVGVSYLAFYRRSGGTKVQVVQRDSSGQLRKKTVTTDELDASKREMRTIILERDLLQSALTRIYEAETEGQITKEERETIARRYSSQIRELETKLRDKELLVEVGELEGLRDELVTLFREKIQNIESRLDQAKDRLPAVREQIRPESPKPTKTRVAVTPVATTSAMASADDLEKVVERKSPARRDESDGEKRVRELRDEIMDAVARLEQIDTTKETEQA